ncbi:hypothetical protein M426DRAFT_258502 [Hypoxylon sp. CI-4A]|nr:hypothetical protein M426DRAFT_258502 [Hypoxylon sp. CI-4A]
MHSQITADDAFASAQSRMDTDRYSTLEKLPVELQDHIISFCDAPSAMNLALTGPKFYNIISQDEIRIAKRMVLDQVGVDLSPLVILRYYADEEGWPVARNEEPNEKVVEEMSSLMQALADWDALKTYNPFGFNSDFECTLVPADTMLSFHKTVCYYADTLSRHALTRGPRSTRPEHNRECPVPGYVTSVSETEMKRFVRSLYIFHVSSILFAHEFNPLNADGTASKMQRAWDSFWSTFWPWEHQQTRCIQVMLQGHLSRVAKSEPSVYEENDQSWSPSDPLLGQFTIFMGLDVLRNMEIQGAMKASLKTFEKCNLQTSLCRQNTWCEDTDLLWLRRDAHFVFLDVRGIKDTRFRVQETEFGPSDAWLHTLLQRVVEDPILEPGKDCQFACEDCMTKWGFVFWDRSKLAWYSKGKMPTAGQMINISSGITVPFETYFEGLWGRKHGHCIGSEWTW